MKRPIISFRQVSKIYITGYQAGPTHRAIVSALQDVTVDIFAGESIGVTGPNGSGKTTFLRAIGGTINLTNGFLIRRVRPRMVIALGSGFLESFTGRENVLMYGSFLGIRQKYLQRSLAAIVDFAGLGHVIDEPLRDYSQGMRLRLAFAISTSCQPGLVCFDEVLGIGDQEFQKKSADRIRYLQDQGTTFIITGHNQSSLEAQMQRLLRLEDGRLIEDKTNKPSVR